MEDIVISVKNISKKYVINTGYQLDTLRDKIIELVTYPIRAWKGTHKTKTKNFWALHDVSFDVKRGEILGIIGRNGAGKSTMLKILARITEPTSGEITLSGRVASLLEVGTGFNPELTGRENIYLNGAILGMKKAEISQKFAEIVDFSGIGDFIDTPVKRYSSGMYVRLAFAVAAHLDSDILLIDEVLSVGDFDFQKKSLEKINAMTKDSKKTVIFVSHSLQSVEKLCNRCIYFDKGVVAIDSKNVEAVIEKYSNSSTKNEHKSSWSTSKKGNNIWFSLKKVSVVGSKQSRGNYRYGEKVTLSIEGLLHKKHPAFQVGYALYSQKTGELLYWCSLNDVPRDRWPKVEVGHIQFTTEIPTHILNEGYYRIEPIIALNKIEWLYQPGNNSPAIYFNVEGGYPPNSMWTSYKPGYFAPLSDWYTNKITGAKKKK